MSVEILSPRRAGRRAVAVALAAAAGALAVVLADVDTPPRPRLQRSEFAWAHEPGETLRVTPARHLELPPFGDFELNATVELHAEATLDVVVRRVEPQGGEGFFGRFTVLRVTSGEEGPGWRTREDALFGREARGVAVRPGLPASVRIVARGRELEANVAGRPLGAFRAADPWGAVAFVAHGGPVVVHHLRIRPLPSSGAAPAWALGALCGAVLAAALQLLGSGPWRMAGAAGIGLPVGGLVAHEVVFSHLVPGAAPERAALVAGALWLAPLGAAAGLPRPRWWLLLLGALASFGPLELAARAERERLEPLQDPRLELYFGEHAGPAPFDALASRVRGRGPEVYTVEGADTRVLFLGGGTLFEASPDYGEQVGVRVAAELERRLGDDVDAMVLPTVFAHALQQLLLFRGFYLDLEPDAVVFAASRFEAWPGAEQPARARWEAARTGPRAPAFSTLWELWRAGDDGEARLATPEDLVAVLDALEALSREQGFALVLAAEPRTEPAFRRAVVQWADAHGVPFVGDVLTPDDRPRVEPLVDALAAVLDER